MKKSLFLLPLLAGVALVGCNFGKGGNGGGGNGGGGNGGGGNEGGNAINGSPFTITLATTGYDASQYTYAQDSLSFTAGGVDWSTSANAFGGVTEKYNHDWYAANSNGVMQIKKGEGYLENVDGVKGFTKVTIEWQATYSSEETKYFPVVMSGSSAESLAKAACDQTATLNGTLLGYKSGNEGDQKRYDVYGYTTTYTVSASDAFFQIKSGESASYIASISFAK